MRQLSKNLIFVVLRWSGVPWFIREFFQKSKVTILTYHSPNPECARGHFEVLRRHYHIISLRDYLSSRAHGALSKLPPKSLILTFDDGHLGNFELKGLFQELKIPVTIFLCSGVVGTHRHFWWRHVNSTQEAALCKRLSDGDRKEFLRARGYEPEREYPDRHGLSNEEIEQLKPWVDFQAHTVSHPILPACADDVAEHEIAQCKSELETRYGLTVDALALPNGDYSDRDLLLARNSGYRCTLTQDPGFNDGDSDLFRLRRIALRDDCSIDELLVKASGLWGLLTRLKVRLLNRGGIDAANRARSLEKAVPKLQVTPDSLSKASRIT
jgi:peptidoglycan/xylan/chitin deacetylase (PgdA/CDA1 family)